MDIVRIGFNTIIGAVLVIGALGFVVDPTIVGRGPIAAVEVPNQFGPSTPALGPVCPRGACASPHLPPPKTTIVDVKTLATADDGPTLAPKAAKKRHVDHDDDDRGKKHGRDRHDERDKDDEAKKRKPESKERKKRDRHSDD